MSWLQAQGPSIDVAYAGAEVDRALAVAAGSDVVLLDLDLGPMSLRLPNWSPDSRMRGAACSSSARWEAPGWSGRAWLPGPWATCPSVRTLQRSLRRSTQWPRGRDSSPRRWPPSSPSPPQDVPNLSIQELSALRLYASGLKLDSVARRMNVSPATAKEYLDRVRAKYAMPTVRSAPSPTCDGLLSRMGSWSLSPTRRPPPGEPSRHRCDPAHFGGRGFAAGGGPAVGQPVPAPRRTICRAVAELQDALDLSSWATRPS